MNIPKIHDIRTIIRALILKKSVSEVCRAEKLLEDQSLCPSLLGEEAFTWKK